MHHPDVIHRRWKGFSEFMFWACFSYDKKGPCHIWKKEIEKEKKEIQKYINRWNRGNENRLKEEWEFANGLKRINLARQPAGKKPVWKFNEQNSKRVRKNKKERIDWYRYGKLILKEKLLPFARRLLKYRQNTIV
jgi:hypothetical protein